MSSEQFLGDEYPSSAEFRELLRQFPEDVLAKRYLLTGVPFIFKEHPLQYGPFGKKCNTGLFEQFGDTTAEKQPAHEVRTFGH